jgi:exonuclease III
MISGFNRFHFISWNVRGLRDKNKCDMVKDALLSNPVDIILLQETKLSHIDKFKYSTFLSNHLKNLISINASDASHGSIIAWNDSKFKLISSILKTFSITIQVESESNAILLWISNIYGPNLDEERPSFFLELKELADQIQGPWLLVGDFNFIRNPHERSTLHMSQNELLFNETIWDLSLQELSLQDQNFTWSNMQASPTLSKLDRVLINVPWDSLLPNSTVSSLPHTTSDHFPLLIKILIHIQTPQIFYYYNNWKLKPGFKDLVSTAWAPVPNQNDVVGRIVSKTKLLRQKAKEWKKTLKPDRTHLENAKRVLDLIDWIEERRYLSNLEFVFRSILKRKIAHLIQIVAMAARQIGKVTWCVLGDEDTRFYHSRTSTQLRANTIKTVESEGVRFFTHKEKERMLTAYYRSILGNQAVSYPLIDLPDLYPVQCDLSSLTKPFSEQEILAALKQISQDKSPGPDGFGSRFYQDFWSVVKIDVLNLFNNFFNDDCQLERNNKSFIILLKKRRCLYARCVSPYFPPQLSSQINHQSTGS